MTTTISLCMIVKNEEDSLGRCLDSINHHVDEIIIVDTGSTDRTINIAKRYTDNIYHFDWINDFSAARNESLKYATSTWILILDADDYMEEKDIIQLREYLFSASPQPNIAFQIPYISIIGQQRSSSINKSTAIRIFPNRMGIRYHRPIHEQVMSERGISMKAVALNIPIYHTGYLDDNMESKRKHERNMLIFHEMKQHMTLTAYDYYTLGNQHLVVEEFAQGLEAYQHALELSHIDDPWFTPLLVCILDTMMQMEHFIEAWVFAQEHMQSLMHYADIQCLTGIVLNRLGFHERAKVQFLAAIQLADEKMAIGEEPYITNADYAYLVPIRYLIQQYEREGDLAKCIFYLSKLIVSNPTDVSALSKMIQLMSLQETPSSIIHFLDQMIPKELKQKHYIMLAKITLYLGNRDLALAYTNSLSANDLEPHEWLRYALLHNDREQFYRVVQQSTPDQLEHPLAVKHLRLGSILWESSDDYLEWTNDVAANMLYELYTLQQYECYDWLIQHFNSSIIIINQIADNMYRNHHQEVALQYFSYLLDRDELNANNSIHIAQMYINQKNISEALPFIEYALKLEPERNDLRVFYCSQCKNNRLKQQMAARLIERNPDYHLITELLEDK